ncbi:MAG TPA: TolC family protein [Rectinemataceae bacterium]|nr:TolC family protein [Rectinemataceae bacterium]
MSRKSIGASLCAFAFAVTLAADTGPAPGVASTASAPEPAPQASSVALLPEPSSATSLLAPLPATEAGSRVVSLEEAMAAAMAGNDDLSIAQGNLAAARATHATNLAKAEPSLAGSASAGLTEGFGDQTQAKATGASGIGLGEVLSGGLSFAEGTATATSGTRIGLTATQSLPVSPQTGTSGGATNKVAVPQTTLVSATISQTIWDGYLGGQTKAVVDQSLLTLQGKELAARQARSAAAAKVKQAYISALVAQRTLALRLGIQGKQASLLAQIRATYAIKQASAIDLKTAQINARSAELDVETSRHDYSLARQRLATLIGLPAEADYRVAEIDAPKPPASSLDEAIAKGLANRADIAQYDIAKRQALIGAALARGAAQPSLIATGGIGLGFNWGASADPVLGTSSVSAANGQSISLGLKLGLPILDAGAAKAAEAVSSANAGVASTQAAQLRKNVQADIRDAWWNLQILAERTDLAAQSVELAQNQLDLTQAQVKYGTATNQDLLTASVNAANAEVSWLTAKSNQLLAELSLETAMGL